MKKSFINSGPGLTFVPANLLYLTGVPLILDCTVIVYSLYLYILSYFCWAGIHDLFNSLYN